LSLVFLIDIASTDMQRINPLPALPHLGYQ